MPAMPHLLAAVLLLGSPGAFAAETPAGFRKTATPGEFQVRTGTLEGLLRAGGRSQGLAPLHHAATETSIAAAPGIFNYYRVFTTNHRHGESMRGAPSEARLLSPNTVEVTWPPAEDRPFRLTGRYTWAEPGVLDLETTVEARKPLPGFEVFLAAYFAAGFPAGAVYSKVENGPPAFVTAEHSGGVWQVFPKDSAASELIHDGRWAIPPSPVEWRTTAEFAAPLAYRRNPKTGVTAIVMAPPDDCFAVFTPERGEGHRSLYLSLFGRTIAKEETARARARFAAGTGFEEDDIVRLYQDYTTQLTEVEAKE